MDENRKMIANVNVSYKQINSGALLGFVKTDSNGIFKLFIKGIKSDSVQLDFSHLSYAKHSAIVRNETRDFTFILRNEIRKIREVKVIDPPMFKRKDTLNYTVDAFIGKEDRVVADIIKKLPGIQMQGDQILYQGQPIQKFMVNNLDLMGGRYAMINNNLPMDAVVRVQVVENDQPIKILDSLIFSGRASLNLELKKFTTTGTAKISAGVKPVAWDVNVTPMTFGKTFQMLNSLQTNNIGTDVAKGLISYYKGGDRFNTTQENHLGPSYFSIRDINSPEFNENKWLDNQIFMFNSTLLQKLKNGIELKGDVSYYTDRRKRRGYVRSEYFIENDDVVSFESVDNRSQIRVMNLGLLLEKNEKHIFLRNSLKYNRRWDDDQGVVLLNELDEIDQRRRYTSESLQNSLSIGKMFGKQLVDIQSSISYNRTPQSLTVLPGQFTDILNQGHTYDQLMQDVLFTSFGWNNSLGMVKKIRNWRLMPKIVFNYKRSGLQTAIKIQTGSKQLDLGKDYLNDMNSTSLQLATDMALGWERGKWKFYIELPYRILYFDVDQQGIKTVNSSVRQALNPNTNLTYLLDSRNELLINASVGKEYGNLDNFYNGFIVNQYRNMQRYSSRLLSTQYKRGELTYRYKNILKAIFGNVSYRYSSENRDYTFTTLIDDKGRATIGLADRFSGNNIHEVSANISRLFSSSKTVLKFNGTTSWEKSDYLVNENIGKRKTSFRSGSLEVINNFFTFVSGEYKMTIAQNVSRLTGNVRNKIRYNNYDFNLSFYPVEHHSLIFQNSIYQNNISGQKDQYFLDASYRYQIDKLRMEMAFTVNNIWNNKRFIQQSTSNFETVQSYFEMRERQFLISLKFRIK